MRARHGGHCGGVSRASVVLSGRAIAVFVRGDRRALVGMSQNLREVGVRWGPCARVAGRVARPDVNSPRCSARFGVSGVHLARS